MHAVPNLGTTRNLAWRRSRACANATCVEVAQSELDVAVRDSKAPEGAVLLYTRQEWRDFIAGVKAGEFDDLASE